ncbi:MAG: hypothetical protein Fur0032_03490 [Terrimicrobiaceae bacterium]
MKPIFPILSLAFLAGSACAQEVASKPSPATPASAPAELSVRSKALELAGAFSNDGYRIRDGFWSGDIETGHPKLLEVNLFAGNEYWFCAAAGAKARKISVAVFDESGQPVDFLDYSEGATAAAGIEPEVSGRHWVQVELLEGDKTEFCLVYAYK